MDRLQLKLREEKGAHIFEWALGAAILFIGLVGVIAFNEQAWSRRVQVGRCQYQGYDIPDPTTGVMVYDSTNDECCLDTDFDGACGP